jgi:hypothetical protein
MQGDSTKLGITKVHQLSSCLVSLHNMPTKAKILESMIQDSWKNNFFKSNKNELPTQV